MHDNHAATAHAVTAQMKLQHTLLAQMTARNMLYSLCYSYFI